MSKSVDKQAEAVLALINSQPRSPTKEEIVSALQGALPTALEEAGESLGERIQAGLKKMQTESFEVDAWVTRSGVSGVYVDGYEMPRVHAQV